LYVTLRSLYALVSHLCLTGLPEVAMPSSDMWQECQVTLQHTRPCYAKSSYRSVDSQTLHGNVHQVDHVPNGLSNSASTTTFPLRLCGGKPLVEVNDEPDVQYRKLYNRMILSRIRKVLEPKLGTNQNGFRPRRTTVAQILTLRCIIEECRKNSLPAVLTFIDFWKAFDSTDRRKMMKPRRLPLSHRVAQKTVGVC